jgi:glycosyltransferase involved in cell wall biosynthesis
MPNVRIMTEILPQADVYRLINAVDCYVSPHRSEGFGLTVAEAMHYGRAVIATDFGGTTDFVREGVAFPLQYALQELSADRGPYAKGNVWADPSVTHLRELMRMVASNPALCAEVGAAASAAVKAQFSKEAVGRLARRRLRSIAAGL